MNANVLLWGHLFIAIGLLVAGYTEIVPGTFMDSGLGLISYPVLEGRYNQSSNSITEIMTYLTIITTIPTSSYPVVIDANMPVTIIPNFIYINFPTSFTLNLPNFIALPILTVYNFLKLAFDIFITLFGFAAYAILLPITVYPTILGIFVGIPQATVLGMILGMVHAVFIISIIANNFFSVISPGGQKPIPI